MKKKIAFIVFTIIIIMVNIKPVIAIVNIKQDSLYIGIDDTLGLTVTSDNDITWKSNNSNVASVNNGIITGVSRGTTYITATDGSSTDVCKIIVIDNYIPVTNISLSTTNITLEENKTSKIVANVEPQNASNKKLYYSSSDTSIVTVDSNGNIVAKKNGTANIYISSESITRIIKVTVVKNQTVALKNITIPESLSLNEGETSKLVVTYTPNNATNKGINWKSSNTSIVTVDSNGSIKGISSGTATITAISNDGNHVATSKITVHATDNSVKSITLNKTEIKLKIGEEETLVVNFNPPNAENKQVTWTSSNNEVVTVIDGKIKAIKPGKSEIKAISKENNQEATCKVTVLSDPIQSIMFDDESISVYVDSTTTLVTKSTPENTAIENPIWTSSDEEIATVKDGTVTAKKIGKTIITISDESKKITASIEVNVIEKPQEKLLITVDGYELNFDADTKDYVLSIGNETSLNISVNRDEDKYVIGGNRDLKNGSIITITINDKTKTTYIIKIKKKQDYTIYFIGIISLLLFANIIRLLIKNKKKK